MECVVYVIRGREGAKSVKASCTPSYIAKETFKFVSTNFLHNQKSPTWQACYETAKDENFQLCCNFRSGILHDNMSTLLRI